MPCRLVLALGAAWIGIVAFCQPVQADEAPRLEPKQVYGVIVGVLEWQNDQFGSYSKANRQDLELYRTLLRLGVPKSNLAVLLDRQATKDAINDALTRTAEKAPEGSTFLFYYAGHGIAHGKGFYFANYDAAAHDIARTGWPIQDLRTILKDRFRGSQALMLADCCHSGSLALVAEELSQSGVAAACVTSAAKEIVSTSNWTFTQTVIDVLRGADVADRDSSGDITIAELAQEVDDTMRVFERQASGKGLFGNIGEVRLTAVRKTANHRPTDGYVVGQYVWARDSQGWTPGRIRARAQGQWLVQIPSYAVRSTLQVGAEDLLPIAARSLPQESPADVSDIAAAPQREWKAGEEALLRKDDRMWPVIVSALNGDTASLKGFGESEEALTASPEALIKPEAALESFTHWVRWGGLLWPARVVQTEGKRSRVHYIGWTDTWDEWVTPDRMELAEGKPMEARSASE